MSEEKIREKTLEELFLEYRENIIELTEFIHKRKKISNDLIKIQLLMCALERKENLQVSIYASNYCKVTAKEKCKCRDEFNVEREKLSQQLFELNCKQRGISILIETQSKLLKNIKSNRDKHLKI